MFRFNHQFVIYYFLFRTVFSIHFCNRTIHTCGCTPNLSHSIKQGRIVGGERVTQAEIWPWMVSLRQWGHHICGGTLISFSFVLTAAHCISSEGLTIAVGLIDQSTFDLFDSRIRTITEVFIHPDWNSITMQNDVALIFLEKPLEDRSLNWICLPARSKMIPIGSEVITIGFGKDTERSIRSSKFLQQLKLRLLSPISPTCLHDLNDIHTQLCAGLEIAGKDTCRGDSGGPLMYFSPSEQRYELIGITSFGTGCARAHHAGIYTRVSAYLDWIESIVGNDHL